MPTWYLYFQDKSHSMKLGLLIPNCHGRVLITPNTSMLVFKERMTLKMIFCVMFYLELHNAISIDCISHSLPTNVKLVVWAL